nr:Hypothetical protein [Raoultella ornithinolytica]UUW41979.1 hypothetical protein [Klebsiella michiganensis]UWX38744.1 hypothetical protein KK467_p2180 [Klebsiella pneumoniae]
MLKGWILFDPERISEMLDKRAKRIPIPESLETLTILGL